MTPQRINELIQILWNDVDNAEDLQAFVQKYGGAPNRNNRESILPCM